MLLAFEGISRPVELIDSDELVACFSAVLRGWRFAEVASSPARPVITLRRTASGYGLDSPWRSSPASYPDRVDAVCSFLVDLVKAYIADDTSLLCLHCAAVEFAGRLVIFPNRYRAGKSTLCAHLAASGVRLYADDVLPIRERPNRGVAPGILPRLRLPLPADASAAFRAFVDRRQGFGNKRYLYLDIDDDGLAPLGAEAPIGGFVILRREPNAEPALEPASKSEILQSAILRNFAYDVQAADILGRLHGLVDEALCFTLRYDNAEQAVALLTEAFGRWPSSPQPGPQDGGVVPETTARETSGRGAVVGETSARGAAAGAPPSRLRRNPRVVEEAVDHDVFLVNPDSEAIYQLNPVGAALWRLLAEPIGTAQAVDVLHAAFPDVARSQIENDVAELIADLVARGLVLDSMTPDGRRPG